MSILKGYALIEGVPWTRWINMYRHKVQDLNTGIVTPMTSYLLGSVPVNDDWSFNIEYSWNAGTSLTAVAGSASSTSGGGNYYRGRRAIVGGSFGSHSASMQQFGSARPYAAYEPRWCWFEFPLEETPQEDYPPTVYITRVNINASPNTYVEWSEGRDDWSDYPIDWSWEIRNNGDLRILRGPDVPDGS